jgi:membrane-associated phospholipid phosphatase
MTEPSTLTTRATDESRVGEFVGGLRVAEKLLLGFFAYTTVASCIFPLVLRQRLALVGLNLLVCTVVLLLSRYDVEQRRPFLALVRDWLPCVLILVAYRESGLFFVPDPAHRLDYLFVRWDDVLLKNPWVLAVLSFCSPWLQRYLELSYLFCYPSVPLALGSLYLARQFAVAAAGARPDVIGDRQHASAAVAAVSEPPPDTTLIERRYRLAINHFWTAALLAAFTCFLLFPFFPLTPPRELFHDLPGPRVASLLRGLNHWILGRYAVGASLFPSAHVATVTAAALAIRTYLPRVGVAFLLLAGSIALATVYGRYHYAADAVAGVLVGLAAFLVSRRTHRR